MGFTTSVFFHPFPSSIKNNHPSCLPLPYYVLLTPIFRFTTPHHKEGFELFLDTIVAMDDVWVVTAWQTIQWMRNPVDLENIENFPPFQCDYKVLGFKSSV